MAGMDAIDALMTTRAMRRFTGEPVADDDLWTMLEAAQQGPSGGNVQPQQYVVVVDPAKKAAVAALYQRSYARYRKVLGDPPSFRTPEDEASWRRTKESSDHLADHLDDAGALVLVLMPQIPWTPADDAGPLDIGPLYASVYPAVQNLMVAARALGLGTALTTVIRIETVAVRELLGIPELYEIAALIPVGHPAGSFGRARRKPVAAVTHWDGWGARRPRD
jgi:nitroreductase